MENLETLKEELSELKEEIETTLFSCKSEYLDLMLSYLHTKNTIENILKNL